MLSDDFVLILAGSPIARPPDLPLVSRSNPRATRTTSTTNGTPPSTFNQFRREPFRPPSPPRTRSDVPLPRSHHPFVRSVGRAHVGPSLHEFRRPAGAPTWPDGRRVRGHAAGEPLRPRTRWPGHDRRQGLGELPPGYVRRVQPGLPFRPLEDRGPYPADLLLGPGRWLH